MLEELYMEQIFHMEIDYTASSESESLDKNEYAVEDLTQIFLENTNNLQLSPDSEYTDLLQISGNNNIDVNDAFVNGLTRYIVDDRYKCRRPLHYEYFKNRYGDNGEGVSCQNEVSFSIVSSMESGETVLLNPERVSAIHILFAGKGNGLISNFGHISIRLIVCPENDYSEYACNSNITEHLVLGYRAHIDEFKIDPLSGLWGGYRGYLFANRFMDVYQEYAIGEFRELYSLPLKLNKKDIIKLTKALSEIHWSFSGEYRFLDNNCSTMTQKMLLHVWDDFSRNTDMSDLYWRPDKFFSALRNSELSEHKKLEDLTIAEQEGFYFSSTRPIYENAIALVCDKMEKPQFSDLETYIETNPTRRLRHILKDKSYFISITNNSRLLSAQIMLEELSIIKYERSLMANFAYYFDQNDIVDIDSYMKMRLTSEDYQSFSSCILMPVHEHVRPVKREDGIPDSLPEHPIKTIKNKCEIEENRTRLKHVAEVMDEFDSSNWEPIRNALNYWASSIRNVIYLTTMENRQEKNSSLH